MKMKRMNKVKWGVGLALITAVLVSPNAKAALFDFLDAGPLDKMGIGASMTVDGYTLTTVEIRGWDGTLASDGTNNTMNSVGDYLAVNSESTPPNAANDPRDFDPGEAWYFSFDKDVYLSEIDLASLDTVAQMTISSSAFASPFVFNDGDGGSTDTFNLGNTFVAAGTVIVIENSSTVSTPTDSHDFRIDTLTVIPEPATLSLVAAFGGGLLYMRRRLMV